MGRKSIALVNYCIHDCNIYDGHKNIKTDGHFKIVKSITYKFYMDVGEIIFVMEKVVKQTTTIWTNFTDSLYQSLIKH